MYCWPETELRTCGCNFGNINNKWEMNFNDAFIVLLLSTLFQILPSRTVLAVLLSRTRIIDVGVKRGRIFIGRTTAAATVLRWAFSRRRGRCGDRYRTVYDGTWLWWQWRRWQSIRNYYWRWWNHWGWLNCDLPAVLYFISVMHKFSQNVRLTSMLLLMSKFDAWWYLMTN